MNPNRSLQFQKSDHNHQSHGERTYPLFLWNEILREPLTPRNHVLLITYITRDSRTVPIKNIPIHLILSSSPESCAAASLYKTPSCTRRSFNDARICRRPSPSKKTSFSQKPPSTLEKQKLKPPPSNERPAPRLISSRERWGRKRARVLTSRGRRCKLEGGPFFSGRAARKPDAQVPLYSDDLRGPNHGCVYVSRPRVKYPRARGAVHCTYRPAQRWDALGCVAGNRGARQSYLAYTPRFGIASRRVGLL